MPVVAINSGATVSGNQVVSAGTAIVAQSFNINAASNTELIIAVVFQNNVSSISGTYGAKPLVLVTGPVTSTNCGRSYIYHVSAPVTGALNLNLSWTTSSDCNFAAIALDNVAGGLVAASNTGSSATGSVTLATTGSADGCVAMFQNTHTSSWSAGGTGTNLENDSATSINNSCNWLATTTVANQVMSNGLSATDNWVAVGVAALNVAAAAVNLPPFIEVWV